MQHQLLGETEWHLLVRIRRHQRLKDNGEPKQMTRTHQAELVQDRDRSFATRAEAANGKSHIQLSPTQEKAEKKSKG